MGFELLLFQNKKNKSPRFKFRLILIKNSLIQNSQLILSSKKGVLSHLAWNQFYLVLFLSQCSQKVVLYYWPVIYSLTNTLRLLYRIEHECVVVHFLLGSRRRTCNHLFSKLLAKIISLVQQQNLMHNSITSKMVSKLGSKMKSFECISNVFSMCL